MLHHKTFKSAGGAFVLALLLLTSCRDQGHVETPPVPTDPTRSFVERLLPSFGDELQEHVETASTGEAIRDLLETEAKKSWGRRIRGGIKYADLFQKIYSERGYRKAFARVDGLRKRGHITLDVLSQAERHALDSAPYHIARIRQLDSQLETPASSQFKPLILKPQEAEQLVKFMKSENIDPNQKGAMDVVLQRLLTAENPPLPRVKSYADEFAKAFSDKADATAELELRCADGALRYARDMRHFNLKRMDWRQLRDAGGGKVVIYGRLENTFNELANAKPEDALGVLERLQPPHPQYRAHVEALGRYRTIAANGGWGTVKKTKLEIGHQSDRVGLLRERLAKEGYLSPTISNVGAPASDPMGSEVKDTTNTVDQQLVDAVKAYQATHQFKVTGEATPGLWRSLNVPVERRIEQIETSVRHWRESRYRGEKDYVFVNIPDFHAEIYEGGERVMRFRVVVGNRKRECNPKTNKWEYPNATPVQMANMDHLIVNPYWNVPQRIEDEEIRPEMKKDDSYLEKNDYELIGKPGNERIRQKPGDKNALGRVKFIFPNRHNTYMHDTPKQKYFNYPMRAFSHGCVRVSKPVELAKYLLTKEELLSEKELNELLENRKTQKFELANKLPVFFEYYVTRVDDQGRVNFFSDIYRLNAVRNSDDPEEAASCRVKRAKPESTEGDEDAPDASEPRDVGP